KEGLILISLFGWHSSFKISFGISKNVKEVFPVLKYINAKVNSIVEEKIKIKIVRGNRRCLFEHPGAYLGYF
ncbi:MAG: hypothetical protein ACP5IT_10085, partial [Thermoproteota archaeon]